MTDHWQPSVAEADDTEGVTKIAEPIKSAEKATTTNNIVTSA